LIEQAQRVRRRRWPLIVGALVVVVVVVTAGAVGWWFTGGAEYWARSRWQPPKEALLSSMKVHPVPGWKTTVADLGLPPGSTIATLDAPWLPSLFTNTPPRTYLLVSSPSQTTPQWWLTGVDATNGHRLFPSVKLNSSARMPRCFLNGAAVVCISDDRTVATAWVIDGQSGKLTYNGPTNVRLITGRLEAAQAGNYLVAATKGEGLFGVGPNGETTWFIPGAGVVGGGHNDDVMLQGGSREGSVTMFSLRDGRVLTPEFPEGADMHNSDFFDDGFVAAFSERQGLSFFQFFNTAGRLMSDNRVPGMFIGGATGNVTAIVRSNGFGVYGPSGDELLDVDGELPNGVQLIGTTLWVGEDNGGDADHYQGFDLRTGDKGKSCAFNAINGYLGTDGSVFVRSPWDPKSDDLAQAYDLTTCDRVWSIPRPARSLARMTRIGDTLVRTSDDGTELMSLVAPS